MTKTTGITYDPDVWSRRWEKTVGTILGSGATKADDAEMHTYVQRLLGSALIGRVTEHMLNIFHGAGSNGKDVLLGTVLSALGEYGYTASQELLLSSRQAAHDSVLSDLAGRRLIVCSETDDGRKLAESQVKLITGGGRVRSRRLYCESEQLEPSWTIILATNHRPSVRGTDHGIWRRLVLVPFRRRFWRPGIDQPGDDKLRADPELRGKLAEAKELTGVLSWLVMGCLEYQQHGLRIPQAIAEETAEYRRSEDWMGEFLREVLVEDPTGRVSLAALHARLVQWAQRRDFETPDNKVLSAYLRSHDYTLVKANVGEVLTGWRLLANGCLALPS
jgi:putative DNA primase/helicase